MAGTNTNHRLLRWVVRNWGIACSRFIKPQRKRGQVLREKPGGYLVVDAAQVNDTTPTIWDKKTRPMSISTFKKLNKDHNPHKKPKKNPG